jgi:hypothetical protein
VEERQHKTRFGDYWVVEGTPTRPLRRNKRTGKDEELPYTAKRSPYDPEPGFAGLWEGRTAPPPRVDVPYWRCGVLGTIEPRIAAAAPRRWAAEQP